MEAKDIILNDSGVIFYPNEYEDVNLRHTYWYKDKQLQGITGTLIDYAFPRDYDGISAKTLQAAAERGSSVHDAIEAFDALGGEPDTPELKTYVRLKEEYKFETIANEYLVTDKKQFASAIDIVALKDGEVILIDTKTTSEKKWGKVALQLSIYAEMFEKQTGYKVAGLYLLWLRGEEGGFYEVNRVSAQKIRQLKTAYSKQKMDYKYCENPDWFRGMDKAYSKAMEQVAFWQNKADEIKEKIATLMVNEHYHKIDCDLFSATWVDPKKSKKFDSTRFSKEHPDMAEQYYKESMSKGYLTIKVK